MVTRTMVMVIRLMAGVTRLMAGDTLITDMDRTGQVIIMDTGMDIMVAADIIPPLITPILKEAVATNTATASPGQAIQSMVHVV